MCSAKTMLQKIVDLHRITKNDDGEDLLYVDYNVVHEGPFYAFDGLIREGRAVRQPSKTIAFADHYVPTTNRAAGVRGIADRDARNMVERLEQNAFRTGIVHFGIDHRQQGIMHVVMPELGLAHPGMVIVGSDSHTSTNGAFGALSFGVGASQIKHVLATQTVWFRMPLSMRVVVDGTLRQRVSAKDLILAIIAKVGIGGGAGHAIEYSGTAVRELSMEARMTLCNMSIEAGARSGMTAADDKTFEYLQGREGAPQGKAWSDAFMFWQTLSTDPGAVFDREITIDGAEIEPMVTWGLC